MTTDLVPYGADARAVKSIYRSAVRGAFTRLKAVLVEWGARLAEAFNTLEAAFQYQVAEVYQRWLEGVYAPPPAPNDWADRAVIAYWEWRYRDGL